MKKELQINQINLITERDAEGSLKVFRTLPDGLKVAIRGREETLVDVLYATLEQLDNLKNLFDKEEGSPGPLYYLLDDMLQTVKFKIDTLCEMVTEEFGDIDVYVCDGAAHGFMNNAFLGVSRKNA